MIHGICTCASSQLPRVRQLVEYYRVLGVDRFWVTFHVNGTEGESGNFQRRVDALISDLGIDSLPYLSGEFDAELIRANHDHVQARLGTPDDWIIWFDADEFQVYPKNLKPFLADADRRGVTAVSGEFLDRIARNGILVPYDSRISIWEQFPIASNFTASVLKGYTHKVAAAKSGVIITAGNHEAVYRDQISWADDIVAIHHFKWDDKVLNYLRPRLEVGWKRRCPCWPETERAIAHIGRYGGINPACLATFDFGEGYHKMTDHLAWNFVKQLRANNFDWHARAGFLHSSAITSCRLSEQFVFGGACRNRMLCQQISSAEKRT
jgi:hypothetical protein